MSGVVLDASALLALLLNELGAEQVVAALDNAMIGVVNYAEVVSYYARLGSEQGDIEQMLSPLPIEIVDADPALATDSGTLRSLTHSAGLSLGDRFCLALARRANRPVLTADRAWAGLADALGIEVTLIR